MGALICEPGHKTNAVFNSAYHLTTTDSFPPQNFFVHNIRQFRNGKEVWWCLRVVVIWLLSSQLKAAPHSGIRYLSVTKGGSVAIPITDGQCPESDFGLNTERKGPVVTYENNVPTEGLNYLGRIRLNNSNGCAVVISDVTKEDTETVYYPDGVLPGQPRIALKMTSSTESSTTIAAPQQSSTTPGGSIESSTTTAAPQPSTADTAGLGNRQKTQTADPSTENMGAMIKMINHDNFIPTTVVES
ncbi:uncharacterized protein isoform X2 [Salmo salar]|uniref:Uncharacterized protein isoform X2 n=1 Tax=Salmo salar TaxID=8030 RepID=A0ABM3CFM3_SALSA|nr:uncharacterized protein LOC106562427 isoform X2 [Salmo salar]